MSVYLLIALSISNILLLILILQKNQNKEIIEKLDKNNQNIRDEFHKNREESANNLKLIREEVSNSIKSLNDSLLSRFNEFSTFQNKQFNDFHKTLRELVNLNNEKFDKMNKTIYDKIVEFINNLNKISKENREGLNENFKNFEKRLSTVIEDLTEMQSKKFNEFNLSLKEMTNKLEVNLEKVRTIVEEKLLKIQEDNNNKLEKMRETVEEKLQTTLHKRIGESFKLVSDQLEAVQKGLGEMRNLATGVGDLKRVLTNVKSRGTWGEVQLHAILDQILTTDQFSENVQTNPASSERVEFAVKLPGKDRDTSNVWLPIDSKFPQEDYIKLIDALEIGEVDAVQKYRKELEKSILKSSEDISKKYINPPYTTDFAIMFLPTEGLYAEVIRIPGLMEKVQQNNRVIIAGPTTTSAILNSLRVGFKTLAIEKRSAEVWKILSAVKTEFGKFGDILDKVKKQLDTATNTLEQTGVRTRAMARKLKEVEELPEDEATKILEIEQSN